MVGRTRWYSVLTAYSNRSGGRRRFAVYCGNLVTRLFLLFERRLKLLNVNHSEPHSSMVWTINERRPSQAAFAFPCPSLFLSLSGLRNLPRIPPLLGGQPKKRLWICNPLCAPRRSIPEHGNPIGPQRASWTYFRHPVRRCSYPAGGGMPY